MAHIKTYSEFICEGAISVKTIRSLKRKAVENTAVMFGYDPKSTGNSIAVSNMDSYVVLDVCWEYASEMSMTVREFVGLAYEVGKIDRESAYDYARDKQKEGKAVKCSTGIQELPDRYCSK